MRREDDPEAGPGRGGLKPVQGFAIVAGILLAIVVVVALTRPDPPTNSSPDPSRATFTPTEPADDLRLTDAEAIERFKELNAKALKAVRDRDASLLTQVFLPGSPISSRATRVIRGLREDRVFDRSRVRVLSAEVISNGASTIRIREHGLLFPCFVSVQGRDVTKGPRGIERRVVWTMKRVEITWQLSDSQLENDRTVEAPREPCP